MHSIMQRYSTICAPHACITAKACCSNATTTAATNISLQQPRNHLLKNTVLRNSCINATLHAAESLCHRIPVRSSSLGNRNISLALWAIVEAGACRFDPSTYPPRFTNSLDMRRASRNAATAAAAGSKSSKRSRDGTVGSSADQTAAMPSPPPHVHMNKRARTAGIVAELLSGATIQPKAPAPLPIRLENGSLVFADWPDFHPNLTPAEILALGSFGGTYFRNITSGVTGVSYKAKDVVAEFPPQWFEGLAPARYCSAKYDVGVNQYGVKCGGDLHMWESHGWINKEDPYGWFQWYCRFYLGRRCGDDGRQVSRGNKCFGPTGRWRISLCNKINRAGASFNDVNVSPVVRQTLQHWGYRLTQADYLAHCARKGLVPT